MGLGVQTCIIDSTETEPAKARVTIDIPLPNKQTLDFWLKHADNLTYRFLEALGDAIYRIRTDEDPRDRGVH